MPPYHTLIEIKPHLYRWRDTIPSRPMNSATLTVPGPGTTPSVITNLQTEVAIARRPSAPPAPRPTLRPRPAADYPNEYVEVFCRYLRTLRGTRRSEPAERS